MNILGIHVGHDSSVSLVSNGKIIADVAEERFTRTKHYSGLPIRSMEYCLKAGGIKLEEIDVVAVPSREGVSALNFLLDLKGQRKEKESPKNRTLTFMRGQFGLPLPKLPLYIQRFPLPSKTEIVHVDHHLAHAASAYYTSGLSYDDKALVVTMDGIGDGTSVAIWRGLKGKIEKLQGYGGNGSLGWFYGNVTEALGWWHGDGEGKTMGLDPYGDYTKCQGCLDNYYPEYEGGALVKPHKFGRVFFWNESGAFQYHFDDAEKIYDLIIKYGRENIAAEAQKILEEQALNVILPWLEKERTSNLCCAGGTFLNVKLNQRVWESGKVKKHHIFPNAGDSGLALGAALYAYHQANPGAPIQKANHLYWGPHYSDKEIESILKARNLKYRRLENGIDGLKEIARHLAENKIVAWFQGRMESGPRALGNRSILMSANKAENKDTINARVKFREAFRPFCPSILYEKKGEYLENERDECFMITSFTCRKEKRLAVPAVVHEDNTLRPQTVKRDDNELYWQLINEFGKLTGEYLLLNTSFNIMGEPIINHPREAIRSFFDNGIDYLVMGHFILEK